MMLRLSDDLAIDLGTDMTRIHSLQRGAVLAEPTVLARDRQSHRIVAIGGAALAMLGRTPRGIEAVRPLRAGVIADDAGLRALLKELIGRARQGISLLRPRVVLAIPSSVTQLERRGLRDAVRAAGAREVFLIPEPLAVMIGALESVERTAGHLVLDVGAGTTELAIAGLSGRVYLRSIPLGGHTLDEALREHLRRAHGIAVGSRSLEKLKLALSSRSPRTVVVSGRDRGSVAPRSVRLERDEIRSVLAAPMGAILSAVRTAIIEAPPDVCADAASERVLLAGGVALLDGFARQLEKEICLPVLTLPEPCDATVRGCRACLTRLEECRDFGLEVA